MYTLLTLVLQKIKSPHVAMHRSDSKSHAVCEYELNDCVLANNCEHQHI